MRLNLKHGIAYLAINEVNSCLNVFIESYERKYFFSVTVSAFRYSYDNMPDLLLLVYIFCIL